MVVSLLAAKLKDELLILITWLGDLCKISWSSRRVRGVARWTSELVLYKLKHVYDKKIPLTGVQKSVKSVGKI